MTVVGLKTEFLPSHLMITIHPNWVRLSHSVRIWMSGLARIHQMLQLSTAKLERYHKNQKKTYFISLL